MKLLLDYGANPNNSGGKVPLAMASSQPIVDMLIKHGASFDEDCDYTKLAVFLNDSVLLSCLLARGAPLVVAQLLDKQQPMYRALHRQAPYGSKGSFYEESLKLLEVLADETQHRQMDGRCVEPSRILLRRSYSMALQSTVLRSKVRGMPVLLKYPPPGPDSDIAEIYDAMRLSCLLRRKKPLKVLLDHLDKQPEQKKFTCINKRTSGNQTLLHLAARRVSFPILGILLDSGAHVNAQEDGGRTSLHILVSTKRKRSPDLRLAIRLLLVHGASLQACTSRRTPLHVATRNPDNGVTLLSELLTFANKREIAAAINIQDFRGRTALHYAAERGDTRSMFMLFENGAQETVADQDGITSAILCLWGLEKRKSRTQVRHATQSWLRRYCYDEGAFVRGSKYRILGCLKVEGEKQCRGNEVRGPSYAALSDPCDA